MTSQANQSDSVNSSTNLAQSQGLDGISKIHSGGEIGTGLFGGTINGIETDENGDIVGFNPSKFLQGFAVGAGGTFAARKIAQNPKIKAKLEKFAIMARLNAKKANKMDYEIFKKIDKSPKFGSQMEIIGKENLNADVLNYALAKNKRIAINKLDEKIAKKLNFHYPNNVRRTIQPDEIIHSLNRHGIESNLAKYSGQKPVTLDEIAKYQDYADGANKKGLNIDKSGNRVLVSFKRLDDDFYVVVEQIRKTHNELGYKDMYFGRGYFDEANLGEIIDL